MKSGVSVIEVAAHSVAFPATAGKLCQGFFWQRADFAQTVHRIGTVASMRFHFAEVSSRAALHLQERVLIKVAGMRRTRVASCSPYHPSCWSGLPCWR